MDSCTDVRERQVLDLASGEADQWLARFHAGERAVLEQCYREHFAWIAARMRRLHGSVDAETIAQELFYRLLCDARLRVAFRGPNLRAWLTQVVTNAALDVLRRQRRELQIAADTDSVEVRTACVTDELEAKLLIDRFCRERLPAKWYAVFEARFLRQLPQRDAARELKIPRTSLAYQESRIRALLREFLLGPEDL